MQALAVFDNNWDNAGILFKRICKLPPMTILNTFYCKNLNVIEKICSQNKIHLVRRSFGNTPEVFCNELIKIVDFCILFHNHIEYNNFTKFFYDLCVKNNIPYFIFSEHTYSFIFNGSLNDNFFKRCVSSILKNDRSTFLNSPLKIELNFMKNKSSIDEIINNLRKKYSEIETEKCRKQIKIYNKEQISSEKRQISQTKQANMINFNNNKAKWLKQFKSHKI